MKLKKMLFISGFYSDKVDYNGVAKKINLEINTFRELGYEVDYIEFVDNNVYLHTSFEKILLIKERQRFFVTMNALYEYLNKNLSLTESYDFVYVRYEHVSFSMLRFFRLLKKNKDVKIVSELPTYLKTWPPNTSLKNKISFIIKRVIDLYTPKSIDYMATFSDHTKIFNVPAVNIENFVDVKNIPLRHSTNKGATIHLLALAQLSSSHGFDKVIRGMSDFYNDINNSGTKVFLHVVGDGEIKRDLEALTLQLKLQDFVIFYGAKGGEELNEIFNKCDIGIGALAIFRKGVYKASELKIREYTARGLPFIYNAFEPQIENVDFCLKIPFDDSPVDIEKVIEFHKYCKENVDIKKMRLFAEEKFTCKPQLQKILDKLNS